MVALPSIDTLEFITPWQFIKRLLARYGVIRDWLAAFKERYGMDFTWKIILGGYSKQGHNPAIIESGSYSIQQHDGQPVLVVSKINFVPGHEYSYTRVIYCKAMDGMMAVQFKEHYHYSFHEESRKPWEPEDRSDKTSPLYIMDPAAPNMGIPDLHDDVGVANQRLSNLEREISSQNYLVRVSHAIENHAKRKECLLERARAMYAMEERAKRIAWVKDHPMVLPDMNTIMTLDRGISNLESDIAKQIEACKGMLEAKPAISLETLDDQFAKWNEAGNKIGEEK